MSPAGAPGAAVCRRRSRVEHWFLSPSPASGSTVRRTPCPRSSGPPSIDPTGTVHFGSKAAQNEMPLVTMPPPGGHTYRRRGGRTATPRLGGAGTSRRGRLARCADRPDHGASVVRRRRQRDHAGKLVVRPESGLGPVGEGPAVPIFPVGSHVPCFTESAVGRRQSPPPHDRQFSRNRLSPWGSPTC
jgi:hypothetical protein